MPSELQRVALPMGQGLDRETGVMQMRPGSFEDIRNLLLHQGKSIVRMGFEREASLLDDELNPVSHICQGFPLRSERVGIVVSYQSTTKKVHIHRVDTLGATVEYVGEWVHDLTVGWGTTPPKISMCEVYGRIFMAHDQRYVTRRAQTLYYESTGTSQLNNLQGNFKATGNHNLRFRGVVRHLKYLFGWGYGNETEDRPELVRSSRAGDPTSFNPEHYFIAGDRRDPVLSCRPASNRLLVFKEVEGHVIFGSGRDDFGIDILDPRYGCIASQLAANRGGDVIAWSSEGPRVWDGRGPSEEIAIPLELGGAEAVGLITEGEAEDAFAAYIPELRVMGFFFGKRVYCLTTRVERDWKWGYWELQTETPRCGFTLYPGPQDTITPVGYPNIGVIVAGGIYAEFTWANVDQDGDETVEIWHSQNGGAWFLGGSVFVSPSSPQTSPRQTGFVPGTDYRTAMRYRRGTLYTEGYTNADPWLWPSVSRASWNTAIAPPTTWSGVWSRIDAVSEKIALTITPAVGQETQDIKIYRNTVLVHTITGPHVGDVTWDDTGITGETEVTYEFVTVGGSGDSIKSDELKIWAGPTYTAEIDWVLNAGAAGYEVGIVFTPIISIDIQVWDNYDNAGGTGAQALRFTITGPAHQGASGALTGVVGPPGTQVTVQARRKVTAFTVDDFGPWSTHPLVLVTV